MPDLQQQFEKIFANIPFGESGKNILEAEIIYGCLVNDDFVKVTLILAEDSPLRATLPQEIQRQLQVLEQINRVVVNVLAEAPSEEDAPSKESQRPIQQPQKTAFLQNYDTIIGNGAN